MQRLILAIFVVFLLSDSVQADLRTWTDSTGSFSVKAEFSGMSGSNVQLRREDGKIIKVPLARLSEADQAYVQKIRASPKHNFDEKVSSYVHPNFCAAVVVHPKQIVNSPLGKSFRLRELIQLVPKAIGLESDALAQAWDPAGIERITVLIEPLPEGNVAFLPGIVVEFSENNPGLQAIKAIWPQSKTTPSDPKLINVPDEIAGTKVQAYVADSQSLLIAPESTLELMRSDRQSSANVLRGKLRSDYDGSDLFIAYASRPLLQRLEKTMGLDERQLREDEETDEFVKTIVLDITSASIKFRLQQAPSFSLSIDCPRPELASQFEEIANGGISTLLAAISTQTARNQLKQELKDEFPPEGLDFIDSPALKELVQAIQIKRRGRSVDLSIEIPESVVDYLNKSVAKIAGVGPPKKDNGDWNVIFRSSDPRIWNSDVDEGSNRFAIPLSRAPKNIRYLKLSNESGQFVIIRMLNRDLPKRRESGDIGWMGTNLDKWNGRHLGIYNKRWIDEVRGSVHILPMENKGVRGWGFGNHVKLDDGQSYAWDGKTIKKTVFEISVKSTELTGEEKKALLK